MPRRQLRSGGGGKSITDGGGLKEGGRHTVPKERKKKGRVDMCVCVTSYYSREKRRGKIDQFEEITTHTFGT